MPFSLVIPLDFWPTSEVCKVDELADDYICEYLQTDENAETFEQGLEAVKIFESSVSYDQIPSKTYQSNGDVFTIKNAKYD